MNTIVDYLFNKERTDIDLKNVIALGGSHIHYNSEEEKYEQAVIYAVNMAKRTDLSEEIALIKNFMGLFQINDLLKHDFTEGIDTLVDNVFLEGLAIDIVRVAKMAVYEEDIELQSSPAIVLIARGLVPTQYIPVIFERVINIISNAPEDDGDGFDPEFVRLAATHLNEYFGDDYIDKHPEMFILPLISIYNPKTKFSLLYLTDNIDNYNIAEDDVDIMEGVMDELTADDSLSQEDRTNMLMMYRQLFLLKIKVLDQKIQEVDTIIVSNDKTENA